MNKFVAIIGLTCLTLLMSLIVVSSYYLGAKTKPSPTNNPVTPTATVDNVNQSVIYYIKNNQLFRLSPLDSSPTVFLEQVDSYAFSPDHQRIAYIKGYGSDNTTDTNIYIKNLKTGEQTKITKDGPNRGVSWQPQGRYLLVDEGTGPEGQYTVYDSNTGEKFASMGDSSLLWTDEENAFSTQLTSVNPERPWEDGQGSSLGKLNILTGKTEIIKKADAKNDYGVGETIDGSCLDYWNRSVADSADWLDSTKIKTTNYCLDLQTNQSRVITNASLNNDLQVKSVLKQMISGFTDTSSWQISKNDKYQGWVIVWVNTGGSVYDSNIVMFNLTNPQQTYRQIATGADVTWL